MSITDQALRGQPVDETGMAAARHAVQDGAFGGRSEQWWLTERNRLARERQSGGASEAMEQRWQRIRGDVASRLQLFNLRHADHAWQLRHGHGIAATALVQLHADRDGEVKVAGKLFTDNDQVQDRDVLLYELRGVARAVMAAGQDPRVEMSENPEPIAWGAQYVGVALSMLDADGRWRDVRGAATGPMSMPGQLMAVLADGTMLLADRFEQYRPERYRVAASRSLSPVWAGLGRVWQHTPDLTKLTDPATRPLWLRLHELHLILSGHDREQ